MSIDSTLSRQMTMDEELSPQQRFVAGKLPWIVGAAGLLVYLLTLNHWVAFSSLAQVAKVSGWTWYPELSAPVYWLVTSPFKLLPAKLIPFALNCLSAIFAAVTLMLLARSVALLPQDRTLAQRERQHTPWPFLSMRAAWVPPVAAALVCGLQLSFWESATNASTSGVSSVSNHMLDVMLLAYVIRCLLEYRLDERDSWITRAAFVQALGMTNDWAMIGYFPLFLIAVVWIKGWSFFNARFLTRMFLCGVAGLLLYVVQPAYYSMAEIGNVPFWGALRSNLGTQKYLLTAFAGFKQNLLALGLTSILPVLILGIRWPSFLGDTSAKGTALAKLLFHVVHGGLFLACLWVSLDPPVSARNQNLGIPFLSFYYLGALGIGYFTGYFLLVFGTKSTRVRRISSSTRLGQAAVIAVLAALLILVPTLLVIRNLPQIRISNGPLLKEYATQLVRSLPDEPIIVLSDDLVRQTLLEAAIAQADKPKDWLLLNTTSLRVPNYHYYLKERYGKAWSVQQPLDQKHALDDRTVLSLIGVLGNTRKLFYLHPSFGYYFEVLYAEPSGLAYRLLPFSDESVALPPLSTEAIQANETFWANAANGNLPKVSQALAISSETGPLEGLYKLLHLKKLPNRDATALASFYSSALTYWGARLQQQDRLKPAAAAFEQALEINPDNPSARLDLSSNEKLQSRGSVPHRPNSAFEGLLGKYRTLDQLITENGPLDDPTLCFELGNSFFRGGNLRQSGQQFARAISLDPVFLEPYLGLGLLYNTINRPNRALELIQQAKARPELKEPLQKQRGEVLFVELCAHLINSEDSIANNLVDAELARNPGDTNLVWAVTQAYMRYASATNTEARFEKAISVIDQQLSLLPYKAEPLLNKAWIYIQLGRFKEALPALDQVMVTEKGNEDIRQRALLNRAIAYLQLGQLAEAQRDYLELEKGNPEMFQALYGLGDIAYRNKDTNAAIRYYEHYLQVLTNVQASEEINAVKARLQELKPGSR